MQSAGVHPQSAADDPTEALRRLRAALDELPFQGERVRMFRGLPVHPFAFFPGGNGLVRGADAAHFPFGGTLVLGSNWGNAAGFVDAEGRLLRHDERGGPTWAPLLRLLTATGIDPDACFFSNVWPWLHEGKNNFGPLEAWLRDQALTLHCLEFLDATLTLMRPRLIVALGRGPAAFLARRWPAELGAWRGFSLPSMDAVPFAPVPLLGSGGRAICVALTHPSMPMNARLRRAPYTGAAGEARLLADAWQAATAGQQQNSEETQ